MIKFGEKQVDVEMDPPIFIMKSMNNKKKGERGQDKPEYSNTAKITHITSFKQQLSAAYVFQKW